MDCIELTQDCVQLQAFVEMVNESLGSQNARNFDQLSNCHISKVDYIMELLVKYLVDMQKLYGNKEYQHSVSFVLELPSGSEVSVNVSCVELVV